MALHKIENRSRYEIIYEAVKEEIISNRLKPNQKLDLTELSAKFGVSKSPIVTAMTFLEHDGYVSIIPQIGTFVRELSYDELAALFELRLSTEMLVLDYASTKAQKERLQKFSEEFSAFLPRYLQKDDQLVNEYYETESAFHVYLMSCSPPIAQSIARNIFDLTKRTRSLSFQPVGADDDELWLPDDIRVHINIADALIAGDLETAKRITHEDITHTKERVLKYFPDLPEDKR